MAFAITNCHTPQEIVPGDDGLVPAGDKISKPSASALGDVEKKRESRRDGTLVPVELPCTYVVPGGTQVVFIRYPPLKRWAKICCPARRDGIHLDRQLYAQTAVTHPHL